MLFKTWKDSLLAIILDDQNEIKDFEVLNVKVRDGYEEYSDVDSDSDDYRLMNQCKNPIFITTKHYYHNDRSCVRYETHQTSSEE